MYDLSNSDYVFMCFASSDAAFASNLAADLNRAGIETWLEQDNLQVGTPSWQAQIRAAVAKAKAIILIASPYSSASVAVNAEVSLAQGNKRPIFPVWAYGDRWVECVTLGLISSQYIDARGDRYDEGRDTLIQALRDAFAWRSQASNKPRVFVSHSHKDDDITARVSSDLRKAGAQVWLDSADVKDGNFLSRINEALSQSDWLVLVETPAALTSPAVRWEVDAAINLTWYQELRGVIPFMVKECGRQNIPATWRILHYYDATQDYESAMAGLLAALGLTSSITRVDS